MISTVLSFIRHHGLLTPGDTVVVAVSGGADSVALLDILCRLEEYRLTLVVAHLNHQLRGEESDGDEAFVRDLARQHGLPVRAERADVAGYAVRRGVSLEEAGRELRYAFFSRIAAEYGGAKIAVAHHLDDQAETVLMRLLRGSGGTGLCGMRPVSGGGRLIRPLLRVTRKEIETYLTDRRGAFRTDSSNIDTGFLRNRIRHRLLPELADYNPAVAERLAATADALAADEELLERLTDDLFRCHCRISPEQVTFSATKVGAEPRGARLRLYRATLKRVKGDLRRIGHRHLCDMDRLIVDPKPHASLDLPDGLIVAKSYDRIAVATAPTAILPEDYELIVEGPGRYPLPGGGLLIVSRGDPATAAAPAGVSLVRFDLDVAPFPWTVRNFRNGDRFIPSGMTGTRKVKDFFIEKKVPRPMRRRIPLLFSDGVLLWICGLRVSAIAPVTHDSVCAVTVEFMDEA